MPDVNVIPDLIGNPRQPQQGTAKSILALLRLSIALALRGTTGYLSLDLSGSYVNPYGRREESPLGLSSPQRPAAGAAYSGSGTISPNCCTTTGLLRPSSAGHCAPWGEIDVWRTSIGLLWPSSGYDRAAVWRNSSCPIL